MLFFHTKAGPTTPENEGNRPPSKFYKIKGEKTQRRPHTLTPLIIGSNAIQMEQYEANSKSARPLIAKAIIGAEYKFLVAFPITEKLPPRQVQAVEGESTQSQQLALTASTAASAHEQSYLIVYNVF
jgi:hypothetical protein